MKEKIPDNDINVKALNWTGINSNQIKETIWENLKDCNVEIDLDFINKEFAKKKISPKKNVEKKVDEDTIHILSGDRTKNIEIILSK